ncbi:MAG: hypothetical protein IH986_10700 [Planctomycetes bacterium]|nr:hypothetical protein [Planctomycetota bacterium]
MSVKLMNPRDRAGTRTPKGIRRFLEITRLLARGGSRRRDESAHRSVAEVTVWDGRLEAFRTVDLHNRHDPLWEQASQLARVQAEVHRTEREARAGAGADRHRPQARAEHRCFSDVPKSPFGGSNLVCDDMDDDE